MSGISVAQAEEMLRQARFAEEQRALKEKAAIVAAKAEQDRQMKAALKLVEQRKLEERREMLVASLTAQGKVAPEVVKDITGRTITKWIGSPRGAFGPFMERPNKASMVEGDKQRSAEARQQRDQAAYAALRRETLAGGNR
ncbi:hypothetical protein AAC691_19695 [Nguyenibacter vanlangensis]|uniref:Uncharacterized protein n=1 Tax=Nguyenibacter vanlangensis TaxID=1216886 RepID=A0ABZ3D3X9_9PROT